MRGSGIQPYRNLAGDSGVTGFALGAGFIRVRFRDHAIYTYDYPASGRRHVEAMKRLAQAGRGLNTYINQHVGSRHASRHASFS